jgi:hypothetical protein
MRRTAKRSSMKTQKLPKTYEWPAMPLNQFGSDVSHNWHVAINRFSNGKHGQNDWPKFMYEAKDAAMEVPRLALLFKNADAFGVTRQMIQSLIRVKRGDHCVKCGKGVQLQGHHKNYITDESETLCKSCHREEHCE